MGQRKAPCAFEPHVKEILHPVRGAGRSHLHRHHRAHQGHFDLQAREGRAPCDLRRPLRRECYTIAAEQTTVEVAERVSFEAKWRLLARVGVRCYILISNVSGAVKVAPLQILQFPVVLPHKFQNAEKFNLQFPGLLRNHRNSGQAALASLPERTAAERRCRLRRDRPEHLCPL